MTGVADPTCPFCNVLLANNPINMTSRCPDCLRYYTYETVGIDSRFGGRFVNKIRQITFSQILHGAAAGFGIIVGALALYAVFG